MNNLFQRSMASARDNQNSQVTPYDCPYCPRKGIASERALNAHIRHSHGILPVNATTNANTNNTADTHLPPQYPWENPPSRTQANSHNENPGNFGDIPDEDDRMALDDHEEDFPAQDNDDVPESHRQDGGNVSEREPDSPNPPILEEIDEEEEEEDEGAREGEDEGARETQEDNKEIPPSHADQYEEDDGMYETTPLILGRGLPGQKYTNQDAMISCFLYTNEMAVELLLWNVLRKIKAPMMAWRLIHRWGAYAQSMNYNFEQGKTMSKFLSELTKQFHMEGMKPQVHKALIDRRPVDRTKVEVEVVHFSVEEAIRSLLLDNLNNIVGNLIINEDDPFGKFKPKDPDYINEILCGDAYQNNYERFIPKDPTQNYFIVPFKLYLDATSIDKFSNFKVHPIMLALSIHASRVRRLYAGWRPIGFLPSLYDGYSATDRAKMRGNNKAGRGYNIRNLHSCLDVVFKEIAEIQANGGIHFDELTVGGVTKEDVMVIIPCHMVLGDMEGSDILAGKGGSKQHVSRACHCPMSECADPFHKCKWKNVQDVANVFDYPEEPFKSLEEQCEAGWGISQVPVTNAFYKIQFLDNEGSIHLNSPICLLHLMLQGLFKYLGDNIIEPMTAASKAVLDGLVRRLVPMLQQSGTKNGYPRCQFKNGITNLSEVTADEREGIVFIFFLLFTLPQFAEDTEKYIFRLHPDNFPQPSNGSYRQIRKDYAFCCELMLVLYSWASSDGMYRSWLEKYGMDRLRCVLNTVATYAPREAGDGWGVPKFHEMLHAVFYILHLGPPKDFNTAVNEHHHIEASKRTAARTSMIHATFDLQLSKRCFEDIMVRQVTSIFSACNVYDQTYADIVDMNPTQGVGGFPRFKYYRPGESTSKGASTLHLRFSPTESTTRQGVTWQARLFHKLDKKYMEYTSQYPPSFMEYLVDTFCTDAEDNPEENPPQVDSVKYPNLRFRTEWRKGGVGKDGRGIIIRCHPNYRGGQVESSSELCRWFDWCLVKYEVEPDSDSTFDTNDEGGPTTHLFPGRVWIIAEYNAIGGGEGIETHAIMEVASNLPQAHSVLAHSFNLDTLPGKRQTPGSPPGRRQHKFYTVPCESISDSIMCLPSYPYEDDPRWFKCLYIVPVDEWAEKFTGNWTGTTTTAGVPTGIRHVPQNRKLLKCSFR